MGENRYTQDPVKEIIKFIDNHQPEKNWNEFTRTWNKGYMRALRDVRHLLEDLDVANKKELSERLKVKSELRVVRKNEGGY